MICMRIKKNGDVWTVMGRQDVDVLLFQLQYQAGSTEAQASAMGAFPDEKGVDRPVRWLDPMSPVSTSETITIEFVESDTPSPVLTSPVKTTATPPASANVDQNCSFCGRPKANVQRLIAGPGVFICESCVALCNQVLQEPSGGAE